MVQIYLGFAMDFYGVERCGFHQFFLICYYKTRTVQWFVYRLHINIDFIYFIFFLIYIEKIRVKGAILIFFLIVATYFFNALIYSYFYLNRH